MYTIIDEKTETSTPVIMVVDDDPLNLRLAEFVLKKNQFQVIKASSGEECLALLHSEKVDLIMLDYLMPEMDGFEVLDELKKDPVLCQIPVIMLTAESTPDVEVRGFKHGVMDYITKPFIGDIVLQRVNRILEIKKLQHEQSNYNQKLEKEVARQTKKVRDMHDKMILGMAEMVEGRDPNTGGHIKRTSSVVSIFLRRLIQCTFPYDSDFYEDVAKAAPLHDIGKITIDDAILRKPGRFTPEEYEFMKTHSEQGAKILAKIIDVTDDPGFYQIAVNVAHYHHEKYDGTGYPTGLKGEEIPFEARIMALADVFDALVSKRCYKEAYNYDKAFQIIEESSGTHFDPELAAEFIACREELEAYYEETMGYSGFYDTNQ